MDTEKRKQKFNERMVEIRLTELENKVRSLEIGLKEIVGMLKKRKG